MKTLDFPSGHSMDTEWFAVDKDGNIAFFDSDAEGAVPIEIPEQTEWSVFFRDFSVTITPALKQLYLDEKVINKILKKCNTECLNRIQNEEYITECFIVLLNEGKKWEDLNLEDILVEKWGFALKLSPDIPLYLIWDLYDTKEKIITAIDRQLIAKACYCCIDEDCDGYWGEYFIEIKELGLFMYDHVRRRIDPYQKIYSPEIPLKANQFVPNLVDEIPHFKDITFENQELVQPMEFVCCESYISEEEFIDGNVRVISSDNKEIWCSGQKCIR